MKILIIKIKHILPYLYYRTFQFYEKHENEGDSDISAHMWLSVIEMFYLITFVVYPLDVIVFDHGLGQMLREATERYTRLGVILMIAPIGYLLYRLEKPRMKRYYEMMPIWKNETESQRRKKWWILLLVCIFPLISFYPVIKALDNLPSDADFEYTIDAEDLIQNNHVDKTPKKQLILEEIDDSKFWGIKKGEKEIQVVEEDEQ